MNVLKEKANFQHPVVKGLPPVLRYVRPIQFNLKQTRNKLYQSSERERKQFPLHCEFNLKPRAN